MPRQPRRKPDSSGRVPTPSDPQGRLVEGEPLPGVQMRHTHWCPRAHEDGQEWTCDECATTFVWNEVKREWTQTPKRRS